jgi:hypothetical protein
MEVSIPRNASIPNEEYAAAPVVTVTMLFELELA